jgi:hypothetical protein
VNKYFYKILLKNVINILFIILQIFYFFEISSSNKYVFLVSKTKKGTLKYSYTISLSSISFLYLTSSISTIILFFCILTPVLLNLKYQILLVPIKNNEVHRN